MRKSSFFVSLLLLFSSVYSQTQITLTFQAKDSLTQNALALDSVNVKNLTVNCDTTLYDAVSVLTINALWPVGMEDLTSGSPGSLILMQNVPNPFQGSTVVRVYLKNDGDLNLAVYDNQGKKLSEYQNRFEKGWHLFGISAQESEVLFLKVFDDRTTKTIKIINTATGNGRERISYKGQIGHGSNHKSALDTAGFIFYLGNQLRYTAYVNGYQESIVLDNPVSSETYTFALLPTPFTCGSFITISHVAGEVAPVEKTTIYGTVSNIPGETSKCWITSNLGADHQATAVSDATEPSAGWYWQFNRKQGYKHDGSTVTPSWTITSINETSDWITANDPCSIELGPTWRIPTHTEWYNVDNTGGWTNWNGPWGSDLKLHAAGDLNYGGGSLYSRGSDGYYWSSTRGVETEGWYISFNSSFILISVASKAYGFSVRCVRDY
jgi:hypothetical protein